MVLTACGGGGDDPASGGVGGGVATTTTTSTSTTTATTTATTTVDPIGSGSADRSPSPRDRPATLGAAIDATVVVSRLDRDSVTIWHDGRQAELPAADDWAVWSDGEFVYRSAGQDGRTVHASAAILDGSVICETAEPIHHVTRRGDGGYVAAVEVDDDVLAEWDGVGEFGVPLDAVDCRTGARSPIEPVVIFGEDGQTRVIERIAGRSFTGYGDAEGNADFFNEQGVSIDGEDYAGYHAFNRDASIVAYGDMATGAGPHLSPVVVARDTRTGDQLWRSEFEIPFRSLHFVDDRLAVGFIDDEADRLDFDGTVDRLILVDAVTGRQLDEVDVGFELIFVG